MLAGQTVSAVPCHLTQASYPQHGQLLQLHTSRILMAPTSTHAQAHQQRLPLALATSQVLPLQAINVWLIRLFLPLFVQIVLALPLFAATAQHKAAPMSLTLISLQVALGSPAPKMRHPQVFMLTISPVTFFLNRISPTCMPPQAQLTIAFKKSA